MSQRTIVLLGVLLLSGAAVAWANQLDQGDFEIAFRFSYSNLDFDGRRGDSDTTEVVGSVGYMLTDHHELSVGVGYLGGDSSDSVEYGGAYAYNFRAGQSLNPYLAAVILGFAGDLGDIFDLGYGPEFGVKVYPWPHGGMVFGATYRQLDGADRIPDATNTIVFGGMTLKF